jgi:iron(III) transport system permease protein
MKTSTNPTLLTRRLNINGPLTVAILLVGTVLGVGLALPLTRLIGTTAGNGAFTLLKDFFSASYNRTIARNTIQLGVAVGVVGTAVAFMFAYLQARIDVPGKKFLHFIALLPIISPPFAVATAVIVLFGRNGMISNGIFGVRYDIYGFDGLVLVLSLSFFPVIYMSLLGLLKRLDPSLDEAARNLGASRWHVFRTVTVPLMIPGLASGFLLLFVEAIADLANPLVLGGDFTVLSARAYIAITGEYDLVSGSLLALILIAPALAVFMLQRYWVERKSVVTVTGKPAGSLQLETGPVQWMIFAMCCFVALLIIVIYGTVVLGAFTKVLGVNNGFTFDHARFVMFGIGSKAMIDTTRLALLSAPTAGLLGMLIAWLVVRKLKRFSGLVDFVGMLGVAIPGTVLGIAYLLTFRSPTKVAGITVIPSMAGGNSLANGASAIVLILMMRSLPAGLRAAVGALKQIHPSIEEASTSLGANDSYTFRKVTIPLIRPALFSGLAFSFARSMTTLSPIVFLTTPGTKIMTSQILSEVDAGRFGNAFAYCLVLMAIVIVGMSFMRLAVKAFEPRRRKQQSIRTVVRTSPIVSPGSTLGL